jgi:PAS domain S-box-containing protein
VAGARRRARRARADPSGSVTVAAGAFRHRCKDGTLFDVEVTTQDVVFDGRPARVVAVQDVTGRERLLRAPRRRARRPRPPRPRPRPAPPCSRRCSRACPTRVRGRRRRITLANREALHQLGFSSPAELRRGAAVLAAEVHSRDPDTGRRLAPDEEPFLRALATGERVVRDVLVRHRVTGEDRVISSSAVPVRGPDGAVTAAVAVNSDVTERRRAEAALRASEAALAVSEERLRLAQAAARVGTWDLDVPSGRVTWSPQYYALHGLDPDVHAPSQRFWAESIHPDDRARVTSVVAGAGAGIDGRYEIEYRIVRPDGTTRWVLGRGEVVLGADGRPVRMLGANLDVTDRKLAEAERERLLAASEAARADAERARQEAEEARATAERERAAAVDASLAKSQFLATMSHELRTPLNAIAGHVQLMELEIHGPVTEAQRGALARVQRAQRHLLALINDVLNFAKLEAGKVEYALCAVALADEAAEVAALVEAQAVAKGLAFDVRLAPGGGHVWADPDKLRQVLLNLLSNAIKFTDAGGRVTLAVDDADAGGAAARVRVGDTGRGIPADQLDAVFEPFVQVRSPLRSGYAQAAEGTGLGLAISRDLARGMGGDLSAESVPGAGSTFTLTLRPAPDPVPDPAPDDRPRG